MQYFDHLKILNILNKLFTWLLGIYISGNTQFLKDFWALLNKHWINKTFLWSSPKTCIWDLLMELLIIFITLTVTHSSGPHCVGVLITWEMCYFLFSSYWLRKFLENIKPSTFSIFLLFIEEFLCQAVPLSSIILTSTCTDLKSSHYMWHIWMILKGCVWVGCVLSLHIVSLNTTELLWTTVIKARDPS